MIKWLKSSTQYNRGNHMILDGDMFDLSPDMTQSEVFERIRSRVNMFQTVLYMHTIQVSIKDKFYTLKCSETGNCDFRRN